MDGRRPLIMTLTLDIDFAGVVVVGPTPHGVRAIAKVTGGSFEGERLRGTVEGGHDWVLHRADGTMAIDVRLTLRTDDGVPIYLAYQGAFVAEPDAMARFRNGELLARGEYRLTADARFESGHENYRWLNDVAAHAEGEQTRTGPVYRIHG